MWKYSPNYQKKTKIPSPKQYFPTQTEGSERERGEKEREGQRGRETRITVKYCVVLPGTRYTVVELEPEESGILSLFKNK